MQPAPANRFFKVENDTVLGFVLFLIIFAAFFPAVFNEFTTYDDPEYVTSNAHVQNGLTFESIAWAFEAHGANWHPVTWLSHILDGQIFGLKPWGHHLGNVLLHALNTLLVFRVLRKLTGSVGRSFAVALLFGLHPLRVESVAWVAERKDVLSGCFWLLTLLAYVAYVRQAELPKPNHKLKYFTLALGLFALGLLSKSMLVTLPCVLLLLDFWPLGRLTTRTAGQLALEKIPFFLLTAAMSLIAYFAQYHGTALVSALPLSSRIENALVSYCRYLGKIFWPENLCAIYPYPPPWPMAMVCAAGLLLVVISSVALVQWRQRPYLAVGWFWFLGTLVPVIGLVQIGNQSIADRYTYLPSLGILIAVVWGVADWTKNWPRQNIVIGLTTTALAGACCVLTIAQISYWKDTEAMYRRAVAVTQNNTLATIGLGACLAVRGDWDGAMALDREAVKISPDYYEAHYNFAAALLEKDRLDDAIAEFRTAIKCRPGMADGNLNLGVALARKGEIAAAIEQFKEAARLDPANATAHENLGKLLAGQKDFSAAVEEFRLAANLRPNDPLPHYDLATALLNSQHLDEAIAEYRTALKFAPDNAEIHNDLGTALGIKGEIDPAIVEFQAALKLNPQHQMAAANLAKALKIKSQPSEHPAGKN